MLGEGLFRNCDETGTRPGGSTGGSDGELNGTLNGTLSGTLNEKQRGVLDFIATTPGV